MADGDARPLTDEERAELEALRAEKAHREEQERARRERAELEALRAARREVEEAPVAGPAASPASPAPKPAHGAPSGSTGKKTHERTFGERMVLSEGEDDDGMPSMPPAQKITVGICLVVALCVVAYIALSNLGMLG